MDPSEKLCKYKNSFDPEIFYTFIPYTYNSTINYSLDIINDTKITQTNDIFKNISTKPFSTRNSIILANIDMAFNFSRHKDGYILKQNNKKYTFAVLNDDTGLTQYIMYRNPNSQGYGIYKDVKCQCGCDVSNEYKCKCRDQDKDGLNKLVNLTKITTVSMNTIIPQLKRFNTTGIDLVVSGDENIFKESLLVALKTLKSDGTFISSVKLDSTYLYMASLTFNKITLFKPISSEPNSYYIICEEIHINNIDHINNLENNKTITPSVNFINWVKQYSNISQYNLNPNDYDIYKCKAIWNLPQL